MGFENCYLIENVVVNGIVCKTNTASNTAFRGFGKPQAILAMEEVLFKIACELGCSQDLVNENYYVPFR